MQQQRKIAPFEGKMANFVGVGGGAVGIITANILTAFKVFAQERLFYQRCMFVDS